MSVFRKKWLSAAAAGSAIVAAALLVAPPAHAQGWNVSQGTTPSINSSGWWALTYAAGLEGAMIGLGPCGGSSTFIAEFRNHQFDCVGWRKGTLGINQIVRNNAHSLASITCSGATTWYSPNAVGNYNYVRGKQWGTLNSALANDNASAGRGNLC
ncbi:hypothetical protein OG339_27965 [Streptosporangium sp. NBC_01495]|uniref:hypothetical protein n=1 Tax=Streptosporangium sp. NBC_01495 TaxID=2903899 RepID=UPI002E329974|nr:hypothetical protein [Streptosporangium sp. NBC_01495]